VNGGTVAAAQSDSEEHARKLFFRGSFWSLLDYGGSQLVRLASNAILWRLLSEKAFGLMTIVNALIIGLAMFSDVGIGPSIIQHERGDDPDYLNTAWSIQVFRGTILFGIACAVAAPAAWFYGQPEITPLLLLVSVTPLLAGFNSTNLFSASRRLALKQLSIIDSTANFIGTVLMVIVAYITRSVLSLTIAGIVIAALRLFAGHFLLPGIRNRFRWEPTAARALVHFGRWVFIGTLLTFLALNSDRLIFGRLLTIEEVGVYGIAAIWATLASTVLSRIFGTVAFPLLSRAKNLGEAVGPVFRDTRGKVLLAGAFVTTGLITGASPLIRLIYDTRAADAAWIIPVLSAGGWLAALENTNSNAALAMGQPKWLAAANGAKVAGMAVLIPLGYWLAGFPGAIVGFSMSDLFKYAVSAVAATRVGVGAWRQDLVLTGWIVVLSALTLGLRSVIHSGRLPAIADALIVTVVVTAGWAAIWRVPALRRTALA
jgi:O-antigen/teichoic acid export membrane protein